MAANMRLSTLFAAAACWLLACAAGLAPAASAAPAAQPGPAQPLSAPVLERRVKAAFLYKFLGYAEFPPGALSDPATPITMMVAGADDMVAELAAITAGRSVNGRPIVVRTWREGEGALAHLLFVAGADCARAGRVIRASRALLVVSECDGGLQQGAVINFRIVDDHVRFDVSLDAAERNNVRLSSRLLTVANHVQKGSP